jgi:hypothetical protein
MFILPPNCNVPSATSLTMSPVFPNLLYFISHTPSAAIENSDSTSRIFADSIETERLSGSEIVAQPHFRGITAARVSITREIIVAHRGKAGRTERAMTPRVAPAARLRYR